MSVFLKFHRTVAIYSLMQNANAGSCNSLHDLRFVLTFDLCFDTIRVHDSLNLAVATLKSHLSADKHDVVVIVFPSYLTND